MTLMAFALATQYRMAAIEGADSNLMRKVGIAERISDALVIAGDADSRFTLWGAGLCWKDNELVPAIVVNGPALKIENTDLIQLAEFPDLANRIALLLGGEPDGFGNGIYILPVGQGSLHHAPGTIISCNQNSGRIGPHVGWGSGNEGFLTAGHVAGPTGVRVTDSHLTPVGTVIWQHDPSQHVASSGGEPDVALVKFDPGYTATLGLSQKVAGAGEQVEITSTQLQSDILGYFKHILLGPAQACYAECYATDTAISTSGDSGGMVEMQGDVVGMVIGSFQRRDMTIIQSIDYQLTEIRSRSGYMISL